MPRLHLLTLTAALAFTPVPALAQASAISASDKAQGAQAHPQLLQAFGGPYGGPQAAYVARVGRKVAVQSGLSNSERDFTVTLLDSPVNNAFAIPGGYVYVTRQLLALMNSEDELASVLGHEVGHVAARHSASRQRTAAIGGLIAGIVGAAAGDGTFGRLAGAGARQGAQLYTLKYGRDQEYAADSLGVKYITAAGYNPYAAPAMLAALDAETQLEAAVAGRGASAVPGWASTHPNGADRVQRAVQLARATGRPSAPPPQDTAFLRMLDGLAYDGGKAGNLKRVRIVAVKAGDTIDGLARRMAYPDHQRDRFLVLNGLDDDTSLRAGMLVKLIVAG